MSYVHVQRYDKHETSYPLGRHVEKDSRSRSFTFEVSADFVRKSVLWPHNAPVLDQGQVGSCVGNAVAQMLNCAMFAPCRPGTAWLTETDALKLYSAATHLDGLGPRQYYPPNDDGSSGLGGAKAAIQLGYIDTYSHCFTLPQIQAAIQTQPVIVGTPWTNSMFSPDSITGIVSPGPLNDNTIVGGHEYMCQGIDYQLKCLVFLNSWSSSWGGGHGLTGGQFRIKFTDFANLLAADGDVVVPKSSKIS